MRGLIALTGALALASCGGNDVPSPAERSQDSSASTPVVAANDVLLRTDGLDAGAEKFFFAAGKSEVETALAGAIGLALDRASNEECGAGPMEFTTYSDGLRVNFQEGRLVGWTLDETSDDVQIVGDVQIGTARDTALAADGFAPIEDSTLGEEFALGPAIGGFIEEDAVSMLYAGTQCFFR